MAVTACVPNLQAGSAGAVDLGPAIGTIDPRSLSQRREDMLKSIITISIAAMAAIISAHGCHRKGAEEPRPPRDGAHHEAPASAPDNRTPRESRFVPKHIDIIQKIGKQRSGYEAPKNLVIKDRAAFEDVWRKIHYSVFPKPAPPQVDFEKEMIIAVFMGKCATGGHSIDIVDVVEYADKVEVQFARRKPSPGDVTTTATTRPFCLVKVARINKEATFLEVSVGDPQP